MFTRRTRLDALPRRGLLHTAATTLALVIHELATKALKYGALSSDEGTLDVSSSSNEHEVVFVWTERGGPPVASPTGQGGFGSKLIHRAMSAQLGGSLSCNWAEDGVIGTLEMNRKSPKA